MSRDILKGGNKMPDKNKRTRSHWIGSVFLAVIVFAVCCTQIFYSVDKFLSDPLYYTASVPDSNIKIIAIDEKTIQKYGDIRTWDRKIWAELVELLNSGDTDPEVIALDIMYIGAVEETSDTYFAEVCKNGGNVITAVNAVYGTQLSKEGQTISADTSHIEMVEYPYEELKAASSYGFANIMQNTDGYIRYAREYIDYNGERIDFFPVAVYRQYCEMHGIEPKLPKTFSSNLFSFDYTGKSGAYEIVSMCDVLDGTVDVRVFADSAVFVGAYAPGMQDSYHVPIQKGSPMYGVEVHANILESLLEQNTKVAATPWIYAFLAAITVWGYYVLVSRVKLLPSTIMSVAVIGADLLIGKLLFGVGYVINVIEVPIFVLLIYVYHLAYNYLAEVIHRKKVLSAFKKYVAPQVVDEISRQKDFKIVLGGENRNIAVLFVDIRGFTPMSESLAPEQVVEILNEYLQLTTQSVFNNGGTLDKFIGDATMAIFNAPFDLEDYIYKAVCTARDIAAGSSGLEQKLMERFGRSISFGIGINCGNAVVGNIGCEYRMDYTAIGDTVNTAARLESKAGPGEILVSEAVYEHLRGRVHMEYVEKMMLKGKKEGVNVYRVPVTDPAGKVTHVC